MSEIIRKSHNVSRLIYHVVCPIKYRHDIIDDKIRKTIFRTCNSISESHELYFIEVGTDVNHVHFLLQSVPTYSPTQIVSDVKSIIARAVFKYHPYIKKQLWGGELWSDGYYVVTVSEANTESVVADYVRDQGNGHYVAIALEGLQVGPNSSL